MSELKKQPNNREIKKIWLHNNISASLIIPIEIARKHNLTRGNHVIVEDTDRGILIRKLEVEAGPSLEPAAEGVSTDAQDGNQRGDILQND